MVFLTTVEAGRDHRAFLWTTVQLHVSGTTVGGFVETAHTYYFGRAECRGGYWHRGDEARVKDYLGLAGEVQTLVTTLTTMLHFPDFSISRFITERPAMSLKQNQLFRTDQLPKLIEEIERIGKDIDQTAMT